MNREVNVVALVRGEEQYIFMFDEANRTETLRMLGRYAADPQLSFTWYDAAILSQRVREILPAKSTQPASTLSKTMPGNSGVSNESQSPRATPRFKLP
ncbi:MAG: hypothetical protein ABL921_04110 [Pirellula sp.]